MSVQTIQTCAKMGDVLTQNIPTDVNAMMALQYLKMGKTVLVSFYVSTLSLWRLLRTMFKILTCVFYLFSM